MTDGGSFASLRGRLLVATPKLVDPNFERTVVFACLHDENGALGLVLNRPIGQARVVDHLPQWAPHVSQPPVIFYGGPVERSGALALARGSPAGLPAGWLALGGSGLGLVNPGDIPEEAVGIEDLRIFVGYAGWGAGQLEREVAEGAWVAVDAAAGDVFTTDPEHLWRDVLRRQRGELALLAFAPRDASVN